jgi:hypothetical protein
VYCICYWPSPAQSFLGPRPFGLVIIFYCHRFETSLFVASYDSQGHGGGIIHPAALRYIGYIRGEKINSIGAKLGVANILSGCISDETLDETLE